MYTAAGVGLATARPFVGSGVRPRSRRRGRGAARRRPRRPRRASSRQVPAARPSTSTTGWIQPPPGNTRRACSGGDHVVAVGVAEQVGVEGGRAGGRRAGRAPASPDAVRARRGRPTTWRGPSASPGRRRRRSGGRAPRAPARAAAAAARSSAANVPSSGQLRAGPRARRGGRGGGGAGRSRRRRRPRAARAARARVAGPPASALEDRAAGTLVDAVVEPERAPARGHRAVRPPADEPTSTQGTSSGASRCSVPRHAHVRTTPGSASTSAARRPSRARPHGEPRGGRVLRLDPAQPAHHLDAPPRSRGSSPFAASRSTAPT